MRATKAARASGSSHRSISCVVRPTSASRVRPNISQYASLTSISRPSSSVEMTVGTGVAWKIFWKRSRPSLAATTASLALDFAIEVVERERHVGRHRVEEADHRVVEEVAMGDVKAQRADHRTAATDRKRGGGPRPQPLATVAPRQRAGVGA